MSEQIRTYPDSLFYLSAASTADVREQLIKVQQSSKLIRALSDASTVNTNGDKLQDILTGLSFGNSTQRHKYRALYDTTNDRYLIQRNSGTDASKTWVELFRISSSGAITTTGAITAAGGLTTTGGGITLGGTLDANQFYIRNLEKIVGRTRTDSLLVHGATTLAGTNTLSGSTTIPSLTVSTTLSLAATGTLVAGSNSAKPFAYTYGEATANQAITGGVRTDLTSLTALTLPNTASTLTSRNFLIFFCISLLDTSGGSNTIRIEFYNGANGNSSDTQVYFQAAILSANTQQTIVSIRKFTPGASDRTKFGITCNPTGNCTVAGSTASTIFVAEIV